MPEKPEIPETPEERPQRPPLTEEAPKRRPTQAESTPGGVGAPLGTETYDTRPLPALDALLQTNFEGLPEVKGMASLPSHADTHMAGGYDEVHSFDTTSVYDFILMRKGHEDDQGIRYQDEIGAPSTPNTLVPEGPSLASKDVPLIRMESDESTDPQRIRLDVLPRQGTTSAETFLKLYTDQSIDAQHSEMGLYGMVAVPSGYAGGLWLYTYASSIHNVTPHNHPVYLNPWNHALELPNHSGGFRVANVTDPFLAQDAATKNYVDGLSYAGHTLLDGVLHTDTVTQGATEGSLIIGNATPKWDELVISVPAANVRNVLGVDNGETTASWKAILDATNPVDAGGAAAPGTSLIAAHRDHVHAVAASHSGSTHHAEAHQLAAAGGPHTGTLPWGELNKTGSSLADLATRTHASLSDAPADAHHVAFVKGDADLLYDALGGLAAHEVLDTGVHGAGASTLATAADIGAHAGDDNAHHELVTIHADGAHSIAAQVLQAVLAANGQTGHMSGAMFDKLAGIEATADVTDAANVAGAGAVMDSDIAPGEGFLRKTGVGTYTAHKSNLAAAAAPDADEDSADGYSVGSVWIDTTNDDMYICVDATEAAAVWLHLNAGAGAVGAHQLAVAGGPHTDTLPWGDLNKAGSSIADLATRTHASLSDAPANAHHAQAHTVPSHSSNPACRVRHSVGQVIANGVAGALAFNTEDFDTGGLHSTTVNNSRLTAQVSGVYSINGVVVWAGSAAGVKQVQIWLNGTTALAHHRHEYGTGSDDMQHVSTTYYLSAGQYVQLRVYQNSGGALPCRAAGVYAPVFEMHWIA